MRYLLSLLLAGLIFFTGISPAWAFCGFYVAKADSKLYNKTSQVAIARSGDRTILTMANDYEGEVKDFAIVVPVPTVLKKEQVHVAEPTVLERLDAFSAPRLVEYFDADPCAVPERFGEFDDALARPSAASERKVRVATTGEVTGGDDRGAILSGGIRHPDFECEGVEWPQNMAEGERIQATARCQSTAPTLYSTEDEVLRGESEPRSV